jgi:epsin
MDLTSLKDQVSNLTLYDLKAGVRKVQNGMLVIRKPDVRVQLTARQR